MNSIAILIGSQIIIRNAAVPMCVRVQREGVGGVDGQMTLTGVLGLSYDATLTSGTPTERCMG